MLAFAYQKVLKPIFFLMDPEFVHDKMVGFGEFLGRFSFGRDCLGLFYNFCGKDISKTVDGIKFQTPVMLAAGFDYNGRLIDILPSMGFGGVEVGSVTAKPCTGNEAPRLIRLKKSNSILVRKGLKNDGVDAVITRLKQKNISRNFVVGVSIARTNSKECAGIESGIEDYHYSLRRLVEEDVGDYYAINISCPNAFGGEAFTTPELLERLLARLGQIQTSKPIYVKMPINLEWEEFKGLLDVILKFNLNGIIIGNLNKNYGDLLDRKEAPKEFIGGLSGLPTRALSNKLIRHTRKYCGDKLTIIGCGGILSPKDAQEKLDAGADLVQLITGMIYTGPQLVKDICEELSLTTKH